MLTVMITCCKIYFGLRRPQKYIYNENFQICMINVCYESDGHVTTCQAETASEEQVETFAAGKHSA